MHCAIITVAILLPELLRQAHMPNLGLDLLHMPRERLHGLLQGVQDMRDRRVLVTAHRRLDAPLDRRFAPLLFWSARQPTKQPRTRRRGLARGVDGRRDLEHLDAVLTRHTLGVHDHC